MRLYDFHVVDTILLNLPNSTNPDRQNPSIKVSSELKHKVINNILKHVAIFKLIFCFGSLRVFHDWNKTYMLSKLIINVLGFDSLIYELSVFLCAGVDLKFHRILHAHSFTLSLLLGFTRNSFTSQTRVLILVGQVRVNGFI